MGVLHDLQTPALDGPAQNQEAAMIPKQFDMMGIVGYLHQNLQRMPFETEVLRFNMLLETKPTEKDCQDFIKLLQKVQP